MMPSKGWKWQVTWLEKWQQSSQKAPTINRKWGENCDSYNLFFNQGKWHLMSLYFSLQNNDRSSVISAHFLLLSLKRFLMMVLLRTVPPWRKINNNLFINPFRQVLYLPYIPKLSISKIFFLDSDIFPNLKWDSNIFPNIQGDRQSQKWQTKPQHTS